MTKLYAIRTLLLLTLFTFQWGSAQTLVHYWNFNNNSTLATLTAPSTSIVPGAAINILPGGSSTVDLAGGTGQNFSTQNLNAQNGDPAGTHLRFNNPIGGTIEFVVPTTGFENPIFKFATRRSGSGAGTQTWSYSLNGTTFTSFQTLTINDADPELKTLDFSAISGADNNPNFKLRVTFAQGAGGSAGNNRFDNVTLNGTATGGDVNPPVVTITPINGAVNVPLNATPTISFNETVRMADDSPITNDNVDSVIQLRLDNASGTLVPFDATISGNVITITPTQNLLSSQVYYVALIPNAVEDMSGNAVTSENSSTFTTLAPQPGLVAGDMLFVGYRMNADGAEDEIALVTLKSLTPGTVIYITDSKYTSNAQPQCEGAIEWTSPADTCLPVGTIITVQTSTLVTNIGTTLGTGFGLSSNGDQVIVYTGTAASPTYVTAMSSNGWVANNTDCGGSASMIPAGLLSGVNALNTQNAPGNTGGNAVNAYYNGSVAGTPGQIRANVTNAGNWIAAGEATPPQNWPAWNFPTSIQVTDVVVNDDTTITITFSGPVDEAWGSQTVLYTGIDGLASAMVSGNTVMLHYDVPFGDVMYTLTIGNVVGVNGFGSGCPYEFTFDGSLSAPDFNAANGFKMYPNPAKSIVNFSREADITIYDVTGKKVMTANNASQINVSGLTRGIYIVKNAEGFAQKLVVE